MTVVPTEPPAGLAGLYAEDRREHAAVPPVGSAEYRALRDRDRRRRERRPVRPKDRKP